MEHRLLEPDQIAIRDARREVLRLRHVARLVEIDHQADVAADLRADRGRPARASARAPMPARILMLRKPRSR